MAKKTYRPYDPTARVELSGDLRQYLPADHQVFLIEDLVESLDLTPITSVYEQGDGRGQPPYHPVLLTKLLIHAYCAGETSSRQIMRATYEHMETAESVFGQMKDGRGLHRFCSRGLAKVRGEWALWCLTHNPRKPAGVVRARPAASRAGSSATHRPAQHCARVHHGETVPSSRWLLLFLS